jgi:hypothetical protein
MSENIQNADPNAQAAQGQQPPAQAATPNAQAATGSQPNTQIDYKAEYEKLNGKHTEMLGEVKNLRERVKSLDVIEAEKKTAEEQKLKEQGEYKTLLEKAEAEKKQLADQLVARDRADLLARVAKKHSLPDELASRLHGETEADLEVDAAKLAKLIPPPASQQQARQGSTQSPPPAGNQNQKPKLNYTHLA